MKKTYVIDTNVLIQAPYALNCFEENDLIIPLAVAEELDGLKKSEGEKGANARASVRLLEEYRNKGNLLEGVVLETGGILRIEKNFVHVELPPDLPEDKADNRILKVCKGLADSRKSEQEIVLVTKDLILRLKAQMIGIRADDFITEQISPDDAQYTGRCEAYIPEELVGNFKKKGVATKDLYQSDENGNHVLVDFVQEALMASAEEAPLVIIKGMAGTAKTFYSLAVGMEKVYNKPSGEYRRIMVCRPNAQFDDDIGFLPGDEIALSDKIQEIFDRGIIQTEALNFIRGRSIAKTYLIIDEAQNMTPNQVKGIITRAGKDTKIILLGDPNQIDKPFLDERTNGLRFAAKHMKGSPYCWQITLAADECERSVLAMDAVKRL